MADTTEAILLLRLMATGEQVNLWGGYLNVALQTVSRASKGYQALAVTADATISWSNYSATNDGSVGFLKLTGTLTAAVTLTFPNYTQLVNVWNATGQQVTIKCSGQTGVAIPDGVRTTLFCNGTDFLAASSNWIGTSISPLVNSNDVVTKTTLESAIATASLPATAGTILNSAADTTAGYLSAKVAVAGSLTKATTNPGANETLTLTVGSLGLTNGGLVAASFAPAVNTKYRVPTGGTITLPTPTGAGDFIVLSIGGAGSSTLSGVLSSEGAILASLIVSGDQTLILTDYDATRGWV